MPLRFFFCRFLSDYAIGLFLLLDAVRRLSNLIFTFSKIQIGGNKEWHTTTDGEQEMAYLERSRGKNIEGTQS